jgi:hypothetical protein
MESVAYLSYGLAAVPDCSTLLGVTSALKRPTEGTSSQRKPQPTREMAAVEKPLAKVLFTYCNGII